MCETCGCGKPEEFTIKKVMSDERRVMSEHVHDDEHGEHHSEEGHEHWHEHDGHWHSHAHDDHGHFHPHSHDEHGHEAHTHSHSHGDEGHSHPQSEKIRKVDLNVSVLQENNRLAERNRGYFEAKQVICLNMVSSPGSGKTSILEKTIKGLVSKRKIFVIEGDQQTSRDAERIEKSGAPSIQINTGTGCHLDARMVNFALKKMEVENKSLLFIENVGNLVCPALFDLGESRRVIVISVTEGDDKPLKYPYMFESSQLCLINKSDLLPYVDFSVEALKENALKINPRLEFILLSAKTGEGLKEWGEWIEKTI